MKITGFNSAILTSDMEGTIRFFEDLGFAQRHKKKESTKKSAEAFV